MKPNSSLEPLGKHQPASLELVRARVQRVLGHWVVMLLVTMVVNVLWQIASRYLLDRPSAVTEELARYLLIWLGLFGGAYAASSGDHIALDIFPIPAFWQSLVRRTAMTFLGILLIIGGIRLVQLVHQLEQRSAALHIELSWVYLAAPMAGVLMVFFANVDEPFSGREKPDGADSENTDPPNAGLAP